MKELKDYLPYYIGCKIVTPNCEGHAATLTGYMTENGDALFMDDDGKWWQDSDIEPILRPLSAITLPEFIPIMEMIVLTGQQYPERHYRLTLNDAGNPVLHIDNDWFDAKIVLVVKTGSIWRTDTTSANVKIPAEVFNHLRRCGFDVDGLLTANLAITPEQVKSMQA